MNNDHKEFTVNATINGKQEHLQIKPSETTDGVLFYFASLNDVEIAQLRNEVYGNWEKLWGELDQKAINEIGQEIEKHLLQQ